MPDQVLSLGTTKPVPRPREEAASQRKGGSAFEAESSQVVSSAAAPVWVDCIMAINRRTGRGVCGVFPKGVYFQCSSFQSLNFTTGVGHSPKNVFLISTSEIEIEISCLQV